MRLTAQQGKFLHDLATGEKGSPPLSQRVAKAVGDGVEPWVSALVDLLTILGDENEEHHTPTHDGHRSANGRHASKLVRRG